MAILNFKECSLMKLETANSSCCE